MMAILIRGAIALVVILILLLTHKRCTVRPRPCSGAGQRPSTVLGLLLLIAGGLMGKPRHVQGGPHAVVECRLPGIASMLATISSSKIARSLELGMAG